MIVQNENVYRDLAKLAKTPEAIRVYFKNHAKWHKQGRKVHGKTAASTAAR